jgi:hypothetical protein
LILLDDESLEPKQEFNSALASCRRAPSGGQVLKLSYRIGVGEPALA